MTIFRFALPLALLTAPLSAQTVVIISAKNPITKISMDQASQIFLGQTHTFYSGGQAEPLDLPEASETRKAFYQKVTGKSPAQLKAYWSKLSFSGQAQPPKTLPPAEVVKMVGDNPKFIAYVDAASVTPAVKVVLTL